MLSLRAWIGSHTFLPSFLLADYTFQRDGCTVEITGRNIVKTYTSLDRSQRVANIRNTYHLLQIKEVPNTDALVHFFGTTIILSPRGISNLPRTEQELLEAVICVLEALEVKQI
jgi:hypothetical protein